MKLIVALLFLHIHGSLCTGPSTSPDDSHTDMDTNPAYDVVSEVIVRQSTIVIASNVEVLDETEMEEGNLDSENENLETGSKKVTETIQLQRMKLPDQEYVRVAGEYYQPTYLVYDETEGKHVKKSTIVRTNEIFYGLITVGEPKPGTKKQRFLVAFDTGSSNFWLPTTGLKGTMHRIYDSTLSKTSKKIRGEFKIKYGTGETSGSFVEDKVKIGKICIKKQVFGVVNKEDTHLRNAEIDGIMGLGFIKLLAGNPKYPPVFYNMMKNELLEENLFTFYVKKNKKSGEIEKGELTFGRIDESKYKAPLNYVVVDNHDGFWMVGMKTVTMKGAELPSDASVIDSGTTLIIGPVETVNTLYSLMGVHSQKGELPLVDCSSVDELPPITFTIGELELELESKYYVVKGEDTEQKKVVCMVGILGVDNPSRRAKDEKRLWVLGTLFMYKYFTVFNYTHRSIGFAEYRD